MQRKLRDGYFMKIVANSLAVVGLALLLTAGGPASLYYRAFEFEAATLPGESADTTFTTAYGTPESAVASIVGSNLVLNSLSANDNAFYDVDAPLLDSDQDLCIEARLRVIGYDGPASSSQNAVYFSAIDDLYDYNVGFSSTGVVLGKSFFIQGGMFVPLDASSMRTYTVLSKGGTGIADFYVDDIFRCTFTSGVAFLSPRLTFGDIVNEQADSYSEWEYFRVSAPPGPIIESLSISNSHIQIDLTNVFAVATYRVEKAESLLSNAWLVVSNFSGDQTSVELPLETSDALSTTIFRICD